MTGGESKQIAPEDSGIRKVVEEILKTYTREQLDKLLDEIMEGNTEKV